MQFACWFASGSFYESATAGKAKCLGERIFDLQEWEILEIIDIDGIKPLDAVVLQRRGQRYVEDFLAGGGGFEQTEKSF